MSKIMNAFMAFGRDENGASAAEYALILAIVGAGIAAAAIFLGGAIADAMNTAATCISTQGGTC
jgi:pilus assembly protein Flp/PilA